MNSPPAVGRFVGCLLGGAIGDALGYPIEFVNAGALIVAQYGTAPPVDLRFAGEGSGLISDDTQMTLFTAEALLRAQRAGVADPTPFVLAAYQRWYATQAMRRGEAPTPSRGRGLLLSDVRLFARRAPGNTCLSALAQSFMGRAMPTIATPPNHSKGCGAVMRSAPFGLLAPTRTDAFRLARDAAVLTHGHPSGYLSAAYFASLVFDLARDVPFAEAIAQADVELSREEEHAELVAILETAIRLAREGPPGIDAIERLGGGWTGEEALAIALAIAITAERETAEGVAQALWRSAAHGGDSDSTASLTGNLLGAMLGEELLPLRWRAKIELGELITRVARDLFGAAVGAGIDGEAYPARAGDGGA